MSLILKGIDLPKRKDVMHHEKYIIHIYDDGEVYVGKELYDADNRLKGKEKYTKLIIDGVQAIQIPKDHGRIIDERETIRGWCKGCAFNDGICGKDETICEDKEMCKYAPTILEAENECERCKHKGDEYWCRDAYTGNDGKCSIAEE